MMQKNSKILVTGAAGMAGSAVVRRLQQDGYTKIIPVDIEDCDLRDASDTLAMFNRVKPEYVFHIAARVGGIHANNSKGGLFIYDNLMMQCNVIEAARITNVKKLLFCGSACIYPKNSPQPIQEEYLLSGLLEETNKPYAIAKIAGVTMCQAYRKQYGCNFIATMPTNLYGPGDNFNLEDSHVLPALMRKIHDAKIKNLPFVEVWGTGTPRREFIYIDDLADAFVFLMNNYDGADPINVGTGWDMSIKELVDVICNVAAYRGKIVWNTEYPDGVSVRKLNVTKLRNLGWTASTFVDVGIRKTYPWFLDNYENIRK